ncbi:MULTISPECIES: MurR/RpiR family transcriptional regulator [Lactobacillus]|uniref:MurR/RpiR family transcriptional regulator n=1 Tax=Lactobacillus xujianguonis TaxID=2495899 RepID=A0A437SV27_9LACO|nr:MULTISPECIES: MurR/RpiR family transcriptional regulator [Lactobacillus]RVU70786.1 MurR/RpiR family transcriptional regulator [Lactobacillus xujianguonis]RVU73951.1 MurR/RpiR family transcriptional regulator [Lactobacillus xujianguonis]
MQIDNQVLKQYATLSKSSQKIADYYLCHQADFLANNAAKLGKLTSTSGATIIRFCKQLGFSGLKDFQIELAIEMPKKESETIDTIIQANDQTPVVLNKLYTSLKTNLQDLAGELDRKQIAQVVKLMKSSHMIYLEGIAASSLPAQDLFYKLIRIGKAVCFVSDIHVALEQVAAAQKDDLVLIFSYSGLTKEILLIAKEAQHRGAKVVAVTRNKHSPLTALADIVLALPINEQLLRYGAVNSLFSEMFISSLLYLSLISPDLGKLQAKMRKTEKIVSDLKEVEENGN